MIPPTIAPADVPFDVCASAYSESASPLGDEVPLGETLVRCDAADGSGSLAAMGLYPLVLLSVVGAAPTAPMSVDFAAMIDEDTRSASATTVDEGVSANRWTPLRDTEVWPWACCICCRWVLLVTDEIVGVAEDGTAGQQAPV
jgi:hypothetical protein